MLQKKKKKDHGLTNRFLFVLKANEQYIKFHAEAALVKRTEQEILADWASTRKNRKRERKELVSKQSKTTHI